MKILLYTDVHFSSYSSIVKSRGDKYSTRLEYLINGISWAESLVNKYNCDAVVCCGDFFDKPELNAEELTALTEIVWSSCPHYFIVGNHESNVSSLEYNSVNVLSKNTNFNIIRKVNKIVTDVVELCFLPYITETGRKPIKEYIGESQCKKRIIFSHNDIKGIVFGNVESKVGFSINDIEGSCDLYINGHIHNSSHITDKIVNLGSISAHNFTNDSLKYKYGAWILDTETLKLEFIENPYSLNFYKLVIENSEDTHIFDKLTNAVCSVKCLDSLFNSVKDKLKTNTNIIESRIIEYSKASANEFNEKDASDLAVTDYLEQFKSYILNTVGASPLVLDELSEIVKG